MIPEERKHMPREKLPPVVRGLAIPRKKGKKKTPVEKQDIGEDKDVAIFLKYCREPKT